ncbi:MAG: MFS transporter [Terriglobia bacterium]
MKTFRYLVLLAVFRATRSIAAGMISIAFPYLILTTLHKSPLMLGLLYIAGALATAGLGLAAGFLTDLWGQKKTLFLVGVLLPLSAGVVYSSNSLLALFLASAIGGFSATGSLTGGGVGGAAQPIQIVAIAQLTTLEKRTSVLSIFTFMSGAFSAFGALSARAFNVHDVFLAATLIAFAGLTCVLPIHFQEYRGNLRRLSSLRVIGKFTVTGALNGFAAGLIMPFLIPFFVIVYHVPESQMSVYGFIAGALASSALLLAPRMERLWGFVHTIGLTRGIGLLLILLLPLTHIFLLALLVYFVTPALRIMAAPVQQSAITEFVNFDEVGRALGLNQVARLTSSSGAIAFTGYMFDIADIGLPFYVYAGIMAINIALYFRFFKPLENRRDDQSKLSTPD